VSFADLLAASAASQPGRAVLATAPFIRSTRATDGEDVQLPAAAYPLGCARNARLPRAARFLTLSMTAECQAVRRRRRLLFGSDVPNKPRSAWTDSVSLRECPGLAVPATRPTRPRRSSAVRTFTNRRATAAARVSNPGIAFERDHVAHIHLRIARQAYPVDPPDATVLPGRAM
jgi:hypothetical protein